MSAARRVAGGRLAVAEDTQHGAGGEGDDQLGGDLGVG
jgi:hypothetical protein